MPSQEMELPKRMLLPKTRVLLKRSRPRRSKRHLSLHKRRLVR